MSKRIILFNVFYYAILIGLIKLGQDDPSSSLGFGYYIIIFWIIAAALLVFFLAKNIIRPKSILEKIGVFTATPILSILGFVVISTFKEKIISERIFNKNGYRYKALYFERDRNTGGRRIEYYKSIDTLGVRGDVWVKDSTWLYLSKAGDTIKTIRYEDGIEIK